jgi:hypothetical protein
MSHNIATTIEPQIVRKRCRMMLRQLSTRHAIMTTYVESYTGLYAALSLDRIYKKMMKYTGRKLELLKIGRISLALTIFLA